MINKIAQISVFFWILKIFATTLGETTGDMLAMTLDLGYLTSLGLTGLILIALLFLQIRAQKFNPLLFWLSIIGTTTVGTEISDFMDRTLHLGYFYGSLVLIFGLISVLLFWYKREKTLSVNFIHSRPVEIMFWIAVLFSNSLGTAFGDYLSDELELGYLTGALITSGVIALVIAAHYIKNINQTVLFWIAFVFTRPFGATFGDWLTKPTEKGGLDLGTISSSAVTLTLFIIILLISEKRGYKD